ncbi:hypothetical protein NSA47_11680 [Irregularibacter muris]|uniref:Uncharacterized protein n=1 Tax=Irregularibacter muris TaxID=1796619 RepID=A0AAE3HGB0_9FIRM|nr:hypothetical protein [Irregularibacter muris]MCR1899636.1 hypothetical protein [Irregularibacter muris]
MQTYKPCPGVNLLLVNYSNERVQIIYNANSKAFELPKIGPRPPYYCNPRCEQYYPII